MAILNSKRDEFRIYRYKVKRLHLIFPKQTKKLEPTRLNSLSIIENYLENLYPIIKIDLALEQSVYNKIIKHKSDVKVHIELVRYYMKGTDTKKSLKEVHIRKTFSLILDDAVNTVSESAHAKEYPEGDENAMNAVNMGMELFLFAGDLIKANTGIINAVLKNCTITDALMAIITKIGIKKNLIMPTSDNATIYPELVIPPLKLSHALSFLDSYYGIYRTGTIIYFGITRNYILPYCRRCKALASKEQEIVNIVVPKTGSNITDKLCTAVKKSSPKSIYIIADSESFDPKNKDVTGKILQAETVDVVDNERGRVNYTKEANKKVVIKPGESTFYKQAYTTRVNATSVVITVMLKDCDLSVLTPNKVYQFLFEDTKLTKLYKGKYHLVNVDISYIKEERDLTGGALCTFHKNVE